MSLWEGEAHQGQRVWAAKPFPWPAHPVLPWGPGVCAGSKASLGIGLLPGEWAGDMGGPLIEGNMEVCFLP